MIVRDDYVIFATKHSSGEDICIMDSCGRYTLIHVDDLRMLSSDVWLAGGSVIGTRDLEEIKRKIQDLCADD